MKQSQLGFTLVEVMIAVAIIAIIAAIGIPNLLRAKISANEGAVKDDLRMFSSSAESYRAAQRPPTYPESVSDLINSSPYYLSATWSNVDTYPGKHGYLLTYTQQSAGSGFTLLAEPIAGQSSNYYCIDHSGTIIGGTSGISTNESGCRGGNPIA